MSENGIAFVRKGNLLWKYGIYFCENMELLCQSMVILLIDCAMVLSEKGIVMSEYDVIFFSEHGIVLSALFY